MSQYGALAIAWELQLLGVEPIPEVWTIDRILADAGVTRRRGRTPGYQSKGAPYPHPTTRGPGEYHQADLVGPRNLDGGIGFHAFNLIDVGTHTAGSQIIDILRPAPDRGLVSHDLGPGRDPQARAVRQPRQPARRDPTPRLDLRTRGGHLPRFGRGRPVRTAT